METIRETERFKLIEDTLMGVTAFVRKQDGAQTLWNTGYDAVLEKERVKSMCAGAFDVYAEGNEYHE